jgi:hypothetical protein
VSIVNSNTVHLEDSPDFLEDISSHGFNSILGLESVRVVGFYPVHVDFVQVLLEHLKVDTLHDHVRLISWLVTLDKSTFLNAWNRGNKDFLHDLLRQSKHKDLFEVKREFKLNCS